jgi:hypothetical protein
MFGHVQMLRFTTAEQYSTADRSIVRCSVTKQILAICSTALIFLLLFASRQKEVIGLQAGENGKYLWYHSLRKRY